MCAVIKWTALVTAAKGKLRGSVLQFGAGGQVMRSNKGYNQFSNIRWNKSKTNISVVTGNWKLLTNSQRAAWAAMTVNYPSKDRYGNTHYPSPYTLHMRLNTALFHQLGTMISTPNAPVAFTNITPISVTLGGGPTLTLNINVVTTVNERIAVSATSCLSNGRRPPKGLYSQIGLYDMSATTTQSLTTDYVNRFGQIASLSQIFFFVRIFNITTGSYSPPLVTSCNT